MMDIVLGIALAAVVVAIIICLVKRKGKCGCSGCDGCEKDKEFKCLQRDVVKNQSLL